jgi:hypothetical protein
VGCIASVSRRVLRAEGGESAGDGGGRESGRLRERVRALLLDADDDDEVEDGKEDEEWSGIGEEWTTGNNDAWDLLLEAVEVFAAVTVVAIAVVAIAG